MSLVSIDAFNEELATRLPGAPQETITQQLKATLREYSVWSGAWVIKTVPQDIMADQAEYCLIPSTQADVLYTYAAEVDEVRVRFNGTLKPGCIVLNITYPEDKPDALICYVGAKPKVYDRIPEEIVTYDFDTIVDGVVGRMYAMPDKPWTDKAQSPYHLKRFRNGMAVARERVRRLYTTNDPSWKYPKWA